MHTWRQRGITGLQLDWLAQAAPPGGQGRLAGGRLPEGRVQAMGRQQHNLLHQRLILQRVRGGQI